MGTFVNRAYFREKAMTETYCDVLITCPDCGYEWRAEVRVLQGAGRLPQNLITCSQCLVNLRVQADIDVSVDRQDRP